MSTKCKAKRLLKCFCGCTELTEEEVEHIYRLNVQGTLINEQAKKMLIAFLVLRSRGGDDSEAKQLLDVYEKCAEFLSDAQRFLTLDEFDEIVDAGLPYDLEKELKSKIVTGVQTDITHCLVRIQGVCRDGIETSIEYKLYKKEILKKLRN